MNFNGALTLDFKVILGNQNNLLQLGLSTFITSNAQKIALESGCSVYTGYIFQRHTIKQNGFIGGYDFFYMLGYGKNDNLLGSSLSQYNTVIQYEESKNNSFYGLGFGFEKQFLPENLNEFEQRIGRFMMRFSHAHQSFALSFKNDLKVGGLFYGNATDYGDTGSLYVSYSVANSFDEIHQLGFGISLFTPMQDYTQIPNNIINADDGRKNVWHTTGIYKDTFYANTYFQYKRQNNHLVYQLKTGIESNKLGAYIQNNLHDSFGLNPRFPWQVSRKNQLYIEGSTQTFINIY